MYFQKIKLLDGTEPNKDLRTFQGMKNNYGETGGKFADSDQFARPFRSDLARDSDFKSPPIPISNRPGEAVLPAR
jgi:hypothetical protein